MKKTSVKWMMELVDGAVICYSVQNDRNAEDPLIRYKDDFVEGDFYIIDSLNEEGLEKYDVYPEDGSFIMIPKKDVVRTFKEDYESKKRIMGISGKQLKEELEEEMKDFTDIRKKIQNEYFIVILRDDDGKDVLAVLLVKKESGLTRTEINERIQQGKRNGWETSDGWQVSDIIDAIGSDAIKLKFKDCLI